MVWTFQLTTSLAGLVSSKMDFKAAPPSVADPETRIVQTVQECKQLICKMIPGPPMGGSGSETGEKEASARWILKQVVIVGD